MGDHADDAILAGIDAMFFDEDDGYYDDRPRGGRRKKEPPETVTVHYTIVKFETAKAFLITYKDAAGKERTEWFPKSQVAIDEDKKVLLVPVWMMKGKAKEQKERDEVEAEGVAVFVYCAACQEQVNEKDVKTLNIEEDIQGADVLTFKCPKCRTEQKSRRYARR